MLHTTRCLENQRRFYFCNIFGSVSQHFTVAIRNDHRNQIYHLECTTTLHFFRHKIKTYSLAAVLLSSKNVIYTECQKKPGQTHFATILSNIRLYQLLYFFHYCKCQQLIYNVHHNKLMIPQKSDGVSK